MIQINTTTDAADSAKNIEAIDSPFAVQVRDCYGDTWPLLATMAKAFPTLEAAKAWVKLPEFRAARVAYVESVCPNGALCAEGWDVVHITAVSTTEAAK